MGKLSSELASAVFYGIVDSGYVPRDNMFSKCEQLILSGAKIIQLRAKKEDESERREMAYELLPLFDKPDAPFFIINDDVELAVEIIKKIPNAGVHIGQDDMDVKDARTMISRGILGLSTHSIEQAKAADALSEYLDYFAVGPVFATNTKPGRPAVGLELVKEVCRMRPALPWFAIGGVNLKTATSVREAGAERIVAVSDVLLPSDTTAAVKSLIDEFLK